MVEIDLSGAASPETYSQHTLLLSQYALANGHVRYRSGDTSARARSLSGPDIWTPSAALDDEGKVVGVSCDCPNGQKGGVRARCWHAAALERLIEEKTA